MAELKGKSPHPLAVNGSYTAPRNNLQAMQPRPIPSQPAPNTAVTPPVAPITTKP